MRALRLILASAMTALLALSSRAQDAVLVLTPSSATTVLAGTGQAGFGGDNGAAATAALAAPSGLAKDGNGNLYIADTRNHRIRRISAGGTIVTVAGTGEEGFSGDGGPAPQAELDSPGGLAVAADGTLYIADTRNHRIRRVDASGIIQTVAGTGTRGFSGDGGKATAAQLFSPSGLALGLNGELYLADTGNHRIRRIDSNGNITTVAGDGTQGRSADGTPALTAHLDTPASVTVRADGSLLIADRRNDRILVLGANGLLSTLGTANTALRRPSAVAVTSEGDTLIADAGNFRVAQISSNGAGSVLGSGEQGTPNTGTAPNQTALGAPAAILGGAGAGANQLTAVDRDHSEILQVALPQLSFPDTVVATTSTTRSLLLQNGSATLLQIAALSVPSGFTIAASTSCGTPPFTLRAGDSCKLDIAFAPLGATPVSALLEVDPVNGPPQRVLLLGTGLRTGTQLASTVSLQTSATLNYAGLPLNLTASVLGGSTAAATGTVTFLDGASELGSGTLNPAAQATFSSAGLPAGSHTLTARYNGDARYLGSLSTGIAINVVASPDFTIAPASSSRVTMQSGSAGVLSLVLQPVSGVLNQTITLATTGLPAGSAITVSPVPVALGSTSANVSITFKLPVALTARQDGTFVLACIGPAFLLLLRRRHSGPCALACLLLTLPVLLQGCGGGYLGGNHVTSQSNGTTYAVTVTASCRGVTGAILTHSTTFTVVVQP